MAWYDPRTWGDESSSSTIKRDDLKDSAYKADAFAGQGEAGYNAMSAEAAKRRAYLEKLASGQMSVSGEQLRQGLQQNLAAQQSMAAGAAPQNAAMAARTAAMQSARLGSGLAGQQAVAGLQERQAAEKALADMIMQQRGQDSQVALGSRQNGNTALGAITPDKSDIEKYGQAAVGALHLVSDERTKEGIRDGDDDANATLKALQARVYKYKGEKYGKGKQLGIVAQELESAGLGDAVMDTPIGKVVHAGKLAGAATAMVAALGRRVGKLEGGAK